MQKLERKTDKQKMDKSLQGKKVAVTGAAGSFGEVFVKDLVQQGAIVYAISRTSSKLNVLAKQHPSIISILCDLTKWNESEKILTEKIPEDIDILINNAGLAKSETLEELTEEGVDGIINVNIKGTLCVTKVVTKKMKANAKGGSIVNISSVVSDYPFPFLLTYAMTKAAINRLTKTLATQLGPHNIRVNSVNPTLVTGTTMGDLVFDTKEKLELIKTHSPLKIPPTTQDISNAVMFFLSGQAKTITGQTLFVDSGIIGG